MTARPLTVPWVTCVCLAACSFAPTYHVPVSTATPAAYAEMGDWKDATPADTEHRGAWWTVFDDPALTALEMQADAANQNLKAAFARLQEARAATRIARADLFPTLTLGADAARSRTSVNAPRFLAGAEPTLNNFDLEADLSYEFDLWGRIRNTIASAKATQQASAADLGALYLAIHAEVASDYFALRAQDAQTQLLDRTVEDYARSLQLTQHLYEGGGAALADVEQARAQLETARTQAAETRLQRAQSQHALAVLLGQNASSFSLDASPLPGPLAPPSIEPGLPSTLIERRPDVAAAERRVAAANSQIGVARAAYFPVFSLGAAAGFDSTRSSNWISAPSRVWSVGPQGVLTVFDAGRHAAQTAQAKAMYDEQVADYRSVVLTAYQEVEDNLAAIRQLRIESASESAAVDATGKALQQAQYRYKAGLVTYLEVSTSENTALQAQLTNVMIQLRRMDATVLLIKALGGGWQNGLGDHSAEPPIAVRRPDSALRIPN